MNNFNNSILEDKNDIHGTILVIGGAGRIGETVSRRLLETGSNVVIVDINRKKLQLLLDELKPKYKNRINIITADTTEVSEINNVINTVKKTYGIINSAIYTSYPRSKGWGDSFEDLKQENLKEDLNKQLGAAILFSQKIISIFIEQQKGNLIHISSIQGISAPKFEHYLGTNMSSPIEYSAIKAGIIAITKWLAKAYFNNGIRVNCVSPGGILDSQPDSFKNIYRKSCNNIGLITSDNVASAIIFLLSNEAVAITGQNIIVDDGWSL